MLGTEFISVMVSQSKYSAVVCNYDYFKPLTVIKVFCWQKLCQFHSCLSTKFKKQFSVSTGYSMTPIIMELCDTCRSRMSYYARPVFIAGQAPNPKHFHHSHTQQRSLTCKIACIRNSYNRYNRFMCIEQYQSNGYYSQLFLKFPRIPCEGNFGERYKTVFLIVFY